MAKERLDVLLVSRGLAESREKAKAIIMSGNVYVDGQKEDKAGSNFPAEAVIEVRGNTLKYVRDVYKRQVYSRLRQFFTEAFHRIKFMSLS